MLAVKPKPRLIQNFRVMKLYSAIIIFVCLITQIGAKNAVAQSTLPQKITIGVRELASSIGKVKTSGTWGGFCPLFKQELEKVLQQENPNTIVQLSPITNEYVNRYDELKRNLVQIECGPNTIISDQTILAEKNWEHVAFSEPFHTTGIKILLKKESAKSREDQEGSIAQDKLNNIKFGVTFDTTTYYQIKNSGYDFITFRTREEALQALEKGEKIQAYADDALILKTLLESDYQNEGYALYPQEKGSYLPKTAQENYGLAVLKDSDYAQQLLSQINQTLETENIKQYQDKLNNEESGKTQQQLLEEQDRYITQLLQKFKQEKDTKGQLIIVTAILGILTLVLTYLLVMKSSTKNRSK